MGTIYFRNPRLLILTICLILVSGLSSLQILPRMEDPVLTQRFATIRTIYPGASPERVESLVTEPIEEALDKLEEIKVIESRSNAEISIIQLELHDNIYDIEPVWSKVRDKLNDVAPELPAAAQTPRYEEVYPRAYAIIAGLKWTLPTPPNYALLRRLGETMEERLRAISGTEETKMYGDPEEEILVEIDPTRAATTGLNLQQIASQINNSDAKISSGQLRADQVDLLMEVDSELDSLKRVSRIPVSTGTAGEIVPLSDLAFISKGFKEPQTDIALIDGIPSVVVGVLMESSYRVDTWSAQARQVLQTFSSELPAGVELDLIFDQSKYTTERLANLVWNFIMGATAVMVIILIMMGWKEAIIVGIALPLSSLMVLFWLKLLGIPIHQMSVTGLIIALGLLIDNAIIAVDETKIRLDQGMPPLDAVKSASRFLFLPLLGSTITTILSFAPIAMMPGAAGEFVGSIAIGVIVSILSSLFVSLTVCTTLAGWFLKGDHQHAEGIWIDRVFAASGIPTLYNHLLHSSLKHPLIAISICCILPVAGFVVAPGLQEQFFPPSDRDQFQIKLELPVQSSISETRELVENIRHYLKKYDEITRVHFFMGRSAPIFYYNMIEDRENASNYAQAMIQLKSSHGYFELIRKIQQELDQLFPEAMTRVVQLEQGPPFDAPIEIRIFGPNLERLRDLGEEVRQVLSSTPGVIHTRSDLATILPKLSWKIDEEKAFLSGISNADLAQQLAGNLEGITGGSVFEGTEELPVRVRMQQEQRGDLTHIRTLDLPVSNQPGVTAPLKSFADVNLTSEIASIPHLNRRRVNIVQATITAGTLPQDTLERFLQKFDPQLINSNPGYSYKFGGESAERDDAIGNLLSSVGILMTLMMATLVLSFGSFRLAGMIFLIAIFSAGLGMGSLYIFGFPFGFMAIVGVMGLTGVAINDSICVLSAIQDDERSRNGNLNAIVEVTARSTRHVIATTLTTIAGFIPLIYGGGGQWPPLAIAISGGVGGATFIALFFVPPMYLILNGYAWKSSPTPDTSTNPLSERNHSHNYSPESVMVN